MATALAVFLGTYFLIAARRFRLLHIGRPAGALLGAVSMVLFGVLSPEEAFAAVDLPTLGLLFGMMVLSVYLEEAGFFGALAAATLRRSSSPGTLLGAVVWVSGISSAFLLNDTVCLVMTPILVTLVIALRLDPLPYLLALATSANIGSAATLAGNPQNMLVGTASGIPYREFLSVMAPVAVLCLALNHALLLAVFRSRLAPAQAVAPAHFPHRVRRPMLVKTLAALAGVVAAWLLGADLASAAVAGAALAILLNRFSPAPLFARLDWSLLVFFAALFVVIEGVSHAGCLTAAREWLPRSSNPLGATAFALLSVAGSNLFSNAPFVMAAGGWVGSLPDARLHWYLLALTSTFAGNLTLVGSMANLIVAELSKGLHPIGFREYLRYGVLITVVTTVVGVVYLLAVSAWIPHP
ncbi:MAG: SLC13 family permease [Acidobacteriota bacterium]